MEDIHEEEKYLKLNTKGNHAQYAAEHRKKVENIKNFVLKRKDISDLWVAIWFVLKHRG